MSDEASMAPTEHHKEDQLHDHHEIRSLMLVASLSIHGFLEGIAMGLAKQVLFCSFATVVFFTPTNTFVKIKKKHMKNLIT